MLYHFVILLSIISTISDAQLIDQGSCPTPPTITNFSQSSFSGTWYTILQYPTVYETIARCPTINYGLKSDGTYSISQSEIILINNPSQVPVSWNGVGKFCNSTIGFWRWNVAIMNIDFPNIPYQVIATDYDTYATVYSCVFLGTTRFEFLWIMTKRYPLFAPQYSIQQGIAAAANAGLNTGYLIPAIQLFCTLPTFSDVVTWIKNGFNG